MREVILFSLMAVFLLSFTVAEACDLDVTLLNQDPYPAVPGDYVDLVFQISGLENSQCGTVSVELLENYPIKLDPTEDPIALIKSGTYTKDYSPAKTIPYTVRVDDDALDGDNIIELAYSPLNSAILTKQFQLKVSNVKADFEVYVKDYKAATKDLTLQILNTAENDIYALTVEIPDQEGIVVKGANRNIVGDLDSNDYITTTFEANPQDGDITLNLIYTDQINARRTIEKVISFDSTYFEGRVADKQKSPVGAIITWIVILGLIAWFFIRRSMKKKKPRK